MNTAIQIARQLTDLIYMQGIGAVQFEREFTVCESVNVPVIAEVKANVKVKSEDPETGFYETEISSLEITNLSMQMPGSEEFNEMPAEFISQVAAEIENQF